MRRLPARSLLILMLGSLSACGPARYGVDFDTATRRVVALYPLVDRAGPPTHVPAYYEGVSVRDVDVAHELLSPARHFRVSIEMQDKFDRRVTHIDVRKTAEDEVAIEVESRLYGDFLTWDGSRDRGYERHRHREISAALRREGAATP